MASPHVKENARNPDKDDSLLPGRSSQASRSTPDSLKRKRAGREADPGTEVPAKRPSPSPLPILANALAAESPEPEDDGTACAHPPSSSLTPLASQTPSFDTPFSSTQDGSSKDRPVVIPSSQSDEDLEEDDIFLDESLSQPVRIERQSRSGSGSSDGGDTSRDTDDDSDSDSSLVDLDTLIGRRSMKDDAQDRQRSGADNESQTPTLDSIRRRVATSAKRESHTRQKSSPRYSFSLAKITNQHSEEAGANERISAYRSALERSNDAREPDDPISGNETVDKDLLATVIKQRDEDTQMDQVVQAMNRTDALATEPRWDFMLPDFKEPDLACPPFPDLACKHDDFLSKLADRRFRETAFLTGSVGEWASVFDLPNSVLDWLWDAAINERDDGLSNAYLATFRIARKTKYSMIAHTGLKGALILCGAKPEVLNLKYQIHPVYKPASALIPKPPRRLFRIIRALDELADSLRTDFKGYAIFILMRISLDTGIADDGELSLAIRNAMSSLASSIPGTVDSKKASIVLDDIVTTIDHPILCHRLVDSIPIASGRLQQAKRCLALAFFLSDRNMIGSDLNDPKYLSRRIVKKLKNSPCFDTRSPDLDYRNLSALISLLDIAIAGGFQADLATDQDPDRAPDQASTQRPLSIDERRKQLREEHDRCVDDISAQTTWLFNCIVDRGAAHMNRTQAKSVLEQLNSRLHYAVRSRPRPRRNVFEEVMGKKKSTDGQQPLMEKYLKQGSAGDGKAGEMGKG